ncbi:hypothetical protein AAIR98_000556 [Elusimicrobium simillimum]|uniref:hypothetical protein n=1 Tax=Elusimicrobium simillimum TaxID=3143438 RepID=UPI003C703684
MNMLNKIISLIISISIIHGAAAPSFAQAAKKGALNFTTQAQIEKNYQILNNKTKSMFLTDEEYAKAQQTAALRQYNSNLLPHAAYQKRNPKLTLTTWAENTTEYETDVEALITILADKKYLMSDNVYTDGSCVSGYEGPLACEIGVLNGILPYIKFDSSDAALIVDFIALQLKHAYSANDKEWEAYNRYAIISAYLLANDRTSKIMLDRLLDTICGAGNTINKVWAARALAEVVYLRPHMQEIAIKELEALLQRYSDYLKYKDVEKHHMNLKITNQAMAKKVFMYVVSFFAQKHDDGMIKGMLTDRLVVDESHLFQNPLPGRDIHGNFHASDLGYRHNIAHHAIAALFKIYAMGQKYDAMNNFVIKYSKLRADKKDFQHYVLFAMEGLDMSFAIKDGLDIDGWTDQYNSFMAAMGTALWDMHPVIKSVVNTQGALESAAQFVAVILLFDGAVAGAKYVGGAVIRFALSANAIKFGKTFLGKATSAKVRGKVSKILATSFVGATLISDTPQPKKTKIKEVKLSKETILKRMGN